MGTVVAPVGERSSALGPVSDHDLVAAVRSGDDRAFEKLYERYQRRIAAYVYGMVNDYGRAEDITQEVFISALRRMRETERPIAFKPWIYEIAKNACIDQFRRSRRAEEVSLSADEGPAAVETARLASPGHTPDTAVDAKQALTDLCSAFGGLSQTHHDILVLRELEGLSYREIGERLGMSRPSVESTLFRARRRLSEEYDELVSGERCLRIQSIIVTAEASSLGTRDQRRLSRHIAHCQPCRREARLAGLDTELLARSASGTLARKVAALLPFPGLFRLRRPGGHGAVGNAQDLAAPLTQLSSMAEPIAGWGKAAAAAAALMVAGGAGVAGHAALAGGEPHAPAPARVAPAHPVAAVPAAHRPAAIAKSHRSAGTRASVVASRTRRDAPASHPAASPASGSAAAGAGATSGATGTPSSGGAAGAKAPEAAAPKGSSPLPGLPGLPGGGSPSGGGASSHGGSGAIPQLPTIPAVTAVPGVDVNTTAPADPVGTVQNTVDQAADGAGKAVGDVENTLPPVP